MNHTKIGTLLVGALALIACNEDTSHRTVHLRHYAAQHAEVDVYAEDGDYVTVAVPNDDPSVEVVSRFESEELERVASVASAPDSARAAVASLYAAGAALSSLDDGDDFRAATGDDDECGWSDLGDGCVYVTCGENWCVGCITDDEDNYGWTECYPW